MGLAAGVKLGPYEIQSPLGAGGMGEVYRARDTRLDRTVAIKILPTHLSDNPEFKQRFEREARTISSLNHSHICQLYDIGSHGGTDFLVMEFLDGETLAERLRRGAMPLPELLKTGMEIAEALETAHRAGVVHRDLKPGNVMLTKAGAKLMDFGLAKPMSASGSGVASAPLLSAAKTMSGPTPATPLTTAGSLVGTIQYMAPEQIEGHETDARSDIFAFGAVLYEMATGKRAFDGKSQISVASAILESDPPPISATKPLTPASLDFLVASCLVKDRDRRVQSAHDVGLQLKGISLAAASTSAAAASGQESRRGKLGLWLAGAVLLLAGLAAGYLLKPGSLPSSAVRSYIPPPTGTSFSLSGLEIGPVVVSPDGKTLAFSAVDEQGVTKLWLRPLNAQQATALEGTEDAAMPFWSFDGQWLAFAADGKLKKIGIGGGTPQVIAEGLANESGGGTWNADGTILFCKDRAGAIYQVSASGGEETPATKLKETEYSHHEPFFLPDGKHFLYAIQRLNGQREIGVGELGKPDQSEVVTEGQIPQFADGYLLFSRDGHIMAQLFDPRTWKVSGEPQTLGNARYFSVSTNGMLAYHESSAQAELKVFDRSGNVVATPGPLAVYDWPRFSPDGKSIAVGLTDPKSGTNDIWVFPVMGGPPARITFGGGDDGGPTWSADGKELMYYAGLGGDWSIRGRPLDGSRPEQTIYKNSDFAWGLPIDSSPDGQYLSMHLSTKQDVFSNWVLPLAGGAAFRPPATAGLTASEYEGRFSLDGRWITFFSYETGRPEVYVVPFPGAGAKSQVSTTGGWLPRFGGKELFFVTMGNKLMAARIHTQPTFGVESIRPLFQLDFPNPPDRTSPLYDVSRDGQRFAVLTGDRSKSTTITLLTNWVSEVKR
jgi:eukaryotic-like serine/threonine-protein kinase